VTGVLIHLRRCAALSLFITLAGCVAMTPPSPETYKASLQAAEKQAEQGQIEEAVTTLHALAQRAPERMEPWAYIAKIRFDEKKYSLAIVAADEALSRDASDAGSKVVRAASAMHVAADSIEDLKGSAMLVNTTRVDAQGLAQALRAAYKDEDLFPVKHKPRRNVRPAAPKPVDPGQGAGDGASSSGAATDNRAGSVSPNPFGNLLR
jgi:tetratricopeptide (TPR) repeat protein